MGSTKLKLAGRIQEGNGIEKQKSLYKGFLSYMDSTTEYMYAKYKNLVNKVEEISNGKKEYRQKDQEAVIGARA